MPDSRGTNPYQPPQHDTAASGLASDTEFLVSGKCILCENRVDLPRVCIVTGDNTKLLQKSETLKWTPGWIRNLGIVLGLFGFPIVFGWVQHFVLAGGVAQAGVMAFMPWVVSLAAVLVVVGAVLCWVLCLKGVYRVDVTWHVGRRVVEAERRRRRNRTVLVVCCGAAAVACLCLSLVMEAPELQGACIGLFIAAALLLKGRTRSARPILAGRWHGLNVLMGVSPEFLREVEAIIERQL
ncbi:MAG: hypothetical protein RIK87_03830 [Fuerstiella sp.]